MTQGMDGGGKTATPESGGPEGHYGWTRTVTEAAVQSAVAPGLATV